jgi:hypothetical protein
MSGTVKHVLTKILNDAETHLVDHPLKPERFFYMRPSAFPYCGLRKLLSAPNAFDNGEVEGLAGAYFTNVGTLAHTVFQRFAGQVGAIVGDWRCPACGREKKFTTYSRCKCGGHPTYHELEVRYKNTVVGHLDGLVKIRIGGRDVYVVIDYKTATTSKIERGRKDNSVFPYPYNVQQIRRYVVLMEECFGVEVVGWSLIYLNRDVPLGERNRNIVFKEMKKQEKAEVLSQLDSWVVTHRRVLRAKKLEDFYWVRDRKLCASHQDYMTNWHNEYSPCPIRPFCFDVKRLNKKIDRVIEAEGVYPLIHMASDRIRAGLGMMKKEK